MIEQIWELIRLVWSVIGEDAAVGGGTGAKQGPRGLQGGWFTEDTISYTFSVSIVQR